METPNQNADRLKQLFNVGKGLGFERQYLPIQNHIDALEQFDKEAKTKRDATVGEFKQDLSALLTELVNVKTQIVKNGDEAFEKLSTHLLQLLRLESAENAGDESIKTAVAEVTSLLKTHFKANQQKITDLGIAVEIEIGKIKIKLEEGLKMIKSGYETYEARLVEQQQNFTALNNGYVFGTSVRLNLDPGSSDSSKNQQNEKPI